MLLFGDLNIIRLTVAGMGILGTETLQFRILCVQLFNDLPVQAPLRVEVEASQTHQRQRDHATDQEKEISFNPIHTKVWAGSLIWRSL